MQQTLRPYQLDAIQRVRAAMRRGKRRVLLVAPVGAGKCLGLGTPVLKYDGAIVSVEDIRPGDHLMGPDSAPRIVKSVSHSHGPLYRIEPIKGDAWVCNDAHVLTLVNTSTSDVIDCSLQDYLSRSEWFRSEHKQFSTGVEFPVQDKPLLVDPYFVGVWLGDGTRKLAGVTISNPDPEIRELMHQVARHYGVNVREYNNKPCPSFRLTAERGQPNPLLRAMRQIIDADGALDPSYRVASRGGRMALLAGLLDTDGYPNKSGFEIIQKRQDYAALICFVARSLGFRATISEKRVPGYDTIYWRINLSGDFSTLPMRIPRKKAPPRKQKKNHLRTGFKVVALGDGEYAGFTLDGDGRFLLGDFTVTHNTTVAAHIIDSAVARGKRIVFIAHREELITQCSARLTEHGVQHGIIKAGHQPSHAAAVQVASIQTLIRRDCGSFDLVVIDEAHRSSSKSYLTVLARWPNAWGIGLTASPWRMDGSELGDIFDELVIVASPQELIDAGYILKPRIYAASRPDLTGVRTVGGDFQASGLMLAMGRPSLTGDIIEHWQRHATGRQTILFAAGIEHSRNLVRAMLDADIRAAHVDGTTDSGVRTNLLDRLKTGRLDVLSNVGLFGEGLDLPTLGAAIFARPTQSATLHLQMCGRVMRNLPGKIAPIILDHAGNVGRLGFPWADRAMELNRSNPDAWKKSKAAPTPLRSCAACFAIFERAVLTGPDCPECGAPFTRTRTIRTSEGTLIDVTDLTPVKKPHWLDSFVPANPLHPTKDEKRKLYAYLAAIADKKTYKKGWISHNYRAVFGVWPVGLTL